MDTIIDGIPWAEKVVDNVLVWASDMQELKTRVEKTATNCENLDIILSKKKFAIGTSLQFAGYIISSNGVRPDPDRVEALPNFPTPNNVTGLRSFLGYHFSSLTSLTQQQR